MEQVTGLCIDTWLTWMGVETARVESRGQGEPPGWGQMEEVALHLLSVGVTVSDWHAGSSHGHLLELKGWWEIEEKIKLKGIDIDAKTDVSTGGYGCVGGILKSCLRDSCCTTA
ncbi:hypothetical protein BJV74DRAFT_794299 [Russula compacta]|nr:hypothetical protein BJV74DRAFT_794299 [Russula compacta]